MKWIIGLVAIVVVAGGVSAYVLFANSDESDDSAVTKSTSSEQASLNALFARGKNLKCTYDYTDEDGNQSSGTAYFSGENKMYGEFTNVSGDQTYKANVIRSGDTQYVWERGTSEGYKSNVSNSDKESQTQKSDEYDPDKDYEFTCSSWRVDTSKFTPPSSVTFQDISAKVQESQEALQNIGAEACAKISDATARVACEAAL